MIFEGNMTSVNSTNLSTTFPSPADTTAAKDKAEITSKKNQQVIPETKKFQEVESVKAHPKIITQIEASVLVTQTVSTDGTIVQFPQEGVVEAYRKSQQDLATHQNADILNQHKEKA